MSEGKQMHTALPWSARKASHGPIDIVAADGRDILTMFGGGVDEKPQANAAYIVTACNAFPALVEAGNRLISLFDELQSITTAERIITGRSTETLRKESIAAVQDLRAALAAASTDGGQ